MGLSTSTDEIYATISYFKSKKEALYKIIQSCRQLGDESRSEMTQYLDSFFEITGDLQQVQTEFFDKRKAVTTEPSR